jgi:hypothetical protein
VLPEKRDQAHFVLSLRHDAVTHLVKRRHRKLQAVSRKTEVIEPR